MSKLLRKVYITEFIDATGLHKILSAKLKAANDMAAAALKDNCTNITVTIKFIGA